MRPRILLALVALTFPTIANAQWADTGTIVSAMQNDQRNVVICSDGAGGAIIVWEDYRAGTSDVYAQRISSTGVPQWTANGVVVCNATLNQDQPRMISDGAGGAIITWPDFRNGTSYDVYAQRINASGAALWTANGIAIANAANDQFTTGLVSDGAGGAIIAWQDYRNVPTGSDIYAQRVNSAGVAQWTANGVTVCAAAFDQTFPHVASDGAQGAIISWRDGRSGPNDIYAQRVLSNGGGAWTANGVAVCTAASIQDADQIISDGANGAIIAWRDARSGATDIYAQRLSAAGAPLWAANGLGIATMANDQFGVSLVPDGNQGAFIAWTDARTSPSNNDVYVQHVGAPGITLWAYQGLALSAGSDFEQEVQIVSDGANGIIAVWEDARGGTGGEVYTQRLTSNGSLFWAAGGVRVTTNSALEFTPLPVADGSGNVVVGWYAFPAYPGGPNESNVYATRIDGRFGYWGKPEPTLFAVKDVPNDQGGKVRVEWYASSRDQLNQQAISKYTIWRAIDQAAFASAMAAGVPEIKATDPVSSFSGKMVRREKLQALDYFWELIGTQNAAYRYAYAFTAATSFDSTATNAATHRFQILSHAGTGDLINWPSNILSGRSVDNLAPPAPLFLTAQRIGNYVYLKWNGVHVPDLDKYTVYRKTSSGVTPIPANFLADNPDTLLTDASAPTSALYYIVTATDIHQNQGLKSNEASVAATTGAGNLPPIAALTVLQNHPNPFTDETQLRVGLPARGDVRVEIYDVAGRRVRNVLVPAQEKGWDTLRISARDDRGGSLASGVYFYRVHAGAETVTRKMVIAR